MATSESVEKELGWALGTIMKSYVRAAGSVVEGVPGGLRGYLVLAAVGQGEPRTQVALAQHLGVDRTGMTYLLDEMEDAGLVERRPDPADRRARRVTPTDTGLSRLQELRERIGEAEDDLLGPLECEQRDVLRDLLQRLATSMAPLNPCDLAGVLEERTGPSARARRASRR